MRRSLSITFSLLFISPVQDPVSLSGHLLSRSSLVKHRSEFWQWTQDEKMERAAKYEEEKGEAIFQEWQTVKGQLAAVSLTSGLCSWVMNQVSHPSYCKVEVKLYLHNQKFDLYEDYQASKGPWTLSRCSLHIILVVSWLTLRKCCAFTDMLIKDVLKGRN